MVGQKFVAALDYSILHKIRNETMTLGLFYFILGPVLYSADKFIMKENLTML